MCYDLRNSAAAVVLACLAACGSAGKGVPVGDLHGDVLTPAMPMPDFTLTATDGRPYHFGAETKGSVALLFFGYTHCPDVCPVHMSNLASVLDRLPSWVTGHVKVIFVTVDPDRDTPNVLRAWLKNFNPTFVGLRGSLDAVNRIQAQLHMPQTAVERLPGGGYAVGHGAAVIAVVADSVRVLYPFGTRQADWLNDLPKLAAAIPAAPSSD